ncbi:UDP-glycosyltransferase 71K2-like [Pistacia vera]|uniref:UDP-glycosyltransferase 71K2-like n=1 Tax=Pistacia vera TaxID=55513 RepID=UPI001262E52F|nr:UDP-glycosyltransferase 71K2-like [Pistacia vera]
MKKAELVFIPVSATGHLIPNIELAKRFLSRDNRFSKTIPVIDFPTDTSITAAYTNSFVESNPQIKFIYLPPTADFSPSQEANKSAEKFLTEFIDCHKASVKETIIKHVLSGSDSISLAGLVVDFFCTSMIDVANELGVPSYLFFPSGAAYLGLFQYLLFVFVMLVVQRRREIKTKTGHVFSLDKICI